jgi:hypothetical protein
MRGNIGVNQMPLLGVTPLPQQCESEVISPSSWQQGAPRRRSLPPIVAEPRPSLVGGAHEPSETRATCVQHRAAVCAGKRLRATGRQIQAVGPQAAGPTGLFLAARLAAQFRIGRRDADARRHIAGAKSRLAAIGTGRRHQAVDPDTRGPVRQARRALLARYQAAPLTARHAPQRRAVPTSPGRKRTRRSRIARWSSPSAAPFRC